MNVKSVRFLSCTVTLTLASALGLSAQTPAQSTSATTVPSWFAHCAGENGRCTATGPAQVIFGSSTGNVPTPGGHFFTQTVTGSVLCSDASFGDPAPGHTKACWYGPAAGAGAGKILATGGSNYPFSVQNFESWDNNQRTVVGQYNLDPGLVAAQLEQMHKAGQQNIALVIWYMPKETSVVVNGVIDGAYLDSTSGQLGTQAQQNLIAVLGLIKQIGFSQVTIRLAPVGAASPANWGNTWNEATFEQDEAFTFSTRQTVETAMAGSTVTRTYDLGVEMGGIPHYLNSDGVTYSDGQSPAWTTRLWGDYVRNYGKTDTYGFSIAYSLGTLTAAIAEYDRANTRPNTYAIDIYNPPDLWNYYEELVAAKDTAKPVVMQEVSYNDAGQMQGFTAELQHIPLTVAYLDQWPASASVANADASPPASYGAYGGSTATTGTIVVQPCQLAAGQATCTTTANWSTSNASGVGLYVNGILAKNASNITTALTGTATITLGITPSTIVLASAQGTLTAQGSTGSLSSVLSAAATPLDSKTVAAVDPNAPVVTMAGLGGPGNQSIWAIGTDISSSCTVQLYDPSLTNAAPLATLPSANCNGSSLSFQIPFGVLTNYSGVNLTVTNPGSHASRPVYVGIKTVPTLSMAGLGGPANQDVWAVGTGISANCSIQFYDPKIANSSPIASVTNVSCQSKSLSFALPSSVRSKYSLVKITVTDADGLSSSPVLLGLGGGM